MPVHGGVPRRLHRGVRVGRVAALLLHDDGGGGGGLEAAQLFRQRRHLRRQGGVALLGGRKLRPVMLHLRAVPRLHLHNQKRQDPSVCVCGGGGGGRPHSQVTRAATERFQKGVEQEDEARLSARRDG